MPRPLKVFRTAIGFRDAYVAAPSRAAALRAWGTQKDLFARGAAEEVIDPDLMQAALEKPGEVVYKTRGGLEEQVAALGELPARTPKHAARDEKGGALPPRQKHEPKPKAKPRPSRAKVEAAETAIADLRQEQQRADAALQERERALAAERQALKARFHQELQQLQQQQREARAAYDEAMNKWEP